MEFKARRSQRSKVEYLAEAPKINRILEPLPSPPPSPSPACSGRRWTSRSPGRSRSAGDAPSGPRTGSGRDKKFERCNKDGRAFKRNWLCVYNHHLFYCLGKHYTFLRTGILYIVIVTVFFFSSMLECVKKQYLLILLILLHIYQVLCAFRMHDSYNEHLSLKEAQETYLIKVWKYTGGIGF